MDLPKFVRALVRCAEEKGRPTAAEANVFIPSTDSADRPHLRVTSPATLVREGPHIPDHSNGVGSFAAVSRAALQPAIMKVGVRAVKEYRSDRIIVSGPIG